MTWTPPPLRAGHPYYMHDAIYAQPGALRLVTRGQGDLIAGAASRLRAMDRVLLSGIGTSWHATLVGELLLAHVARLGRLRAPHRGPGAFGRAYGQLHHGTRPARRARCRDRRRRRHRARDGRDSRSPRAAARTGVVDRAGRALRRPPPLLVRRRRAQHGHGLRGGAEDERGEPRDGARPEL